jgi:hypothetical protein
VKKREIIKRIKKLDKESVGDFSEYAQLSEETLSELVTDGEKYLTAEGLKFILDKWKRIDEFQKM